MTPMMITGEGFQEKKNWFETIFLMDELTPVANGYLMTFKRAFHKRKLIGCLQKNRNKESIQRKFARMMHLFLNKQDLRITEFQYLSAHSLRDCKVHISKNKSNIHIP